MWRALRAELAYFRPWMLGGLGIALGVVTIISVTFALVPDGPPQSVAAGLRGFFPVIAGMVVSFIAQTHRGEERRTRLLMAGPLTPRHLAWITVLLPPIMVGIGILAACAVITVESLITGEIQTAGLLFVAGFAGQFYAYAQMGPLAQESTAARRQGRNAGALIGWTLFVLMIPILAAAQLFPSVIAKTSPVIAALGAMAVAWVLYQGRTDFTR